MDIGSVRRAYLSAQVEFGALPDDPLALFEPHIADLQRGTTLRDQAGTRRAQSHSRVKHMRSAREQSVVSLAYQDAEAPDGLLGTDVGQRGRIAHDGDGPSDHQLLLDVVTATRQLDQRTRLVLGHNETHRHTHNSGHGRREPACDTHRQVSPSKSMS